MNPVHNLAPYFFKINSDITFSSMPRPPKRSVPFKFSNQNFLFITLAFEVFPYQYSMYVLMLKYATVANYHLVYNPLC